MIPYTGDYIKHIDDSIDNFKYYTFTPRPLMNGDMYKMDDELSALLIEAHRNIGFWEGLLKYAPNKNVFSELMLLKECTYSLLVDYDGPSFQEVLVSRGGGKGDITRINNLELAYKAAMDRAISEYLYHNKNEYFDLLQTTQYSGGYIRWIKFFVDATFNSISMAVHVLSENGIVFGSMLLLHLFLYKNNVRF